LEQLASGLFMITDVPQLATPAPPVEIRTNPSEGGDQVQERDRSHRISDFYGVHALFLLKTEEKESSITRRLLVLAAACNQDHPQCHPVCRLGREGDRTTKGKRATRLFPA
jgi:hypothetical protein